MTTKVILTSLNKTDIYTQAYHYIQKIATPECTKRRARTTVELDPG